MILSLILSLVAFADDYYEPAPGGVALQNLAVISSNKNASKYNLMLMVDKSNLVAGLYKQAFAENVREGDEMRKSVFWNKEMESKEGAAILVRKNRNILILQGFIDRETQEGEFELKYLANGLLGRYESCLVLLKKNPKGWHLENYYTNKKIDGIFVDVYTLGVRTVKGICPEK